MDELARSPLAAWETFFFLVGSSGAALTGLQFVVITLIAESRRRATTPEIEAYTSPTIIHFCAVLLVSAIVSAPWQGLSSPAFVIGACGLVGLVYGLNLIRRFRQTTTYRPVLEDWLCHALLPMLSYASLLVAAIVLPHQPRRMLFMIGAILLVLLFVGIHNAWDTVTYITLDQSPATRRRRKSSRPKE